MSSREPHADRHEHAYADEHAHAYVLPYSRLADEYANYDCSDGHTPCHSHTHRTKGWREPLYLPSLHFSLTESIGATSRCFPVCFSGLFADWYTLTA
jgi:hypothetical protein